MNHRKRILRGAAGVACLVALLVFMLIPARGWAGVLLMAGSAVACIVLFIQWKLMKVDVPDGNRAGMRNDSIE